MTLANIRRRPTRYAGIDASTNSIAFGVIQDGKLIHYGQEFFSGSNVLERNLSAKRAVQKLVESGILSVDIVLLESAVYVKSVSVAIKLAMVFGTCLAEIQNSGARAYECKPIEWQTAIGNPSLKPAEKLKIQKDYPGHVKSWYLNKGRELRKKRTMDIINAKFGINITDDNIGDAIAISLFATQKLG